MIVQEDPRVLDEEVLASLLDGRLSESVASSIRLALQESSGQVIAAYADAVSIVEELSG